MTARTAWGAGVDRSRTQDHTGSSGQLLARGRGDAVVGCLVAPGAAWSARGQRPPQNGVTQRTTRMHCRRSERWSRTKIELLKRVSAVRIWPRRTIVVWMRLPLDAWCSAEGSPRSRRRRDFPPESAYAVVVVGAVGSALAGAVRRTGPTTSCARSAVPAAPTATTENTEKDCGVMAWCASLR